MYDVYITTKSPSHAFLRTRPRREATHIYSSFVHYLNILSQDVNVYAIKEYGGLKCSPILSVSHFRKSVGQLYVPVVVLLR